MKSIFRALAPTAMLSALVALAPAAMAQVDVQTLGGGRLTAGGPDYGSANGNTFSQAQFNKPWATAVDSRGNMYMADRGNKAVRLISLVGNTSSSQTTTYLTFSTEPLGVVVDGADNLYVLTSNNAVTKYNTFKNLVASNYLASMSSASAMCLTPSGTSLYICGTAGTIVELYQNGTTRTVLTDCGTMNGIGVLPSGEIVVSLAASSSFNNAIVVCATNNPNPALPTVRVLAGNNGAGFQDGEPPFSKFSNPHGLAVTIDGKVVVADRGNHRVRVVEPNGNTSTLYGINPTNWNNSYFPGWADGSQTQAAAREPVSVTISTNGLVFTTEVYYHILREVTGSGLSTGATGGSGNTNVTLNVPAPTFSPNCGYFPNCTTVTVQSGGGNIYYTMDGTEPTTNSIYVPTFNNVGTFTWCNSTNSLASLKMKAIIGTNSSATVSGVSCADNQIGFPKDMVAGVGSTVWLPVVVNLKSGGALRSLQFRVEVTSSNGSPMLTSDLAVEPITSNDFVRVVGPGANLQAFAYSAAPTRGLVLSATGTNGLSINNYAIAAVLKVVIPKTCTVGQAYQLNVLYPSGTSDGVQADVPLTTMPTRTLTIQNVAYLAGDSSPGRWYNAGDFGDVSNPVLTSADVNNALYASLNIRVPYKFSDAFRAMDTFPETNGVVGDQVIKFIDWQTILFRSVGMDTTNWMRFWGTDGTPQHSNTTQVVTPHSLSSVSKTSLTPSYVWLRQAAIGSGVAVNQLPGNSCSLPVWVKVAPGYNLAGMQFRATLVPEGNAPTPGAITFTPAAGIVGGQVLPGVSPNDIVCAWSLGAFGKSLTGSNYIGQINFTVPPGAGNSQHYTLRFSYFDGSPNLTTEYQLECFPGSMWVMSGAATTPSCTSDEWKTYFFGGLTNALADDNADADGDGVCNWKEFIAGTDPLNAGSFLQFTSAITSSNTTVITWQTAPAKTYIIEAANSILSTNWTVVGSDLGDGTVHQVAEPNNGTSQFYRIRVQP